MFCLTRATHKDRIRPPVTQTGRGSIEPEESVSARILIVDDHEVVRQGVRHILETQNDWEVAGEAADGAEALRLVGQLKPDAIIMDITMPVMSGLEATNEIVKNNPDSKVLILTMHESPNLLRPVQHVGARGLLTKSRASRELTPALQAIIAGQTYFH
jgi:two-component system, NarL family, nitrate/nitrite response regulator NarL